MDTYMDLTCYGDNGAELLKKCREKVVLLEQLLDYNSTESDLYLLNHSKGTPVTVHGDTAEVIRSAQRYALLTGGAFNTAVGDLIRLWGFETDTPSVPDPSGIKECLPVLDTGLIRVDGNTVTVPDGCSLHMGAIAKGYCSDCLKDILVSGGIRSACLSLGGNITVVGKKPDGSLWRIAVQDPVSSEAYLGVLELESTNAVTSGGYQRYYEQDGIRYSHILDPKTGYPADSGLLSVTVISGSGAAADALATAFYVLGKEESVRICRSMPAQERPDGVLFVHEDGSVSILGELNFTPEKGVRVSYIDQDLPVTE